MFSWGEAVGINSFAQSYSPSFSEFVHQGQLKASETVSGQTYSSGGRFAVGIGGTYSGGTICTTGLNPHLQFYEFLIYNKHISAATMTSMVRNQQHYLNPRNQLKKGPVAAYSVRKVNTTFYNGPVMLIRRASDNSLA